MAIKRQPTRALMAGGEGHRRSANLLGAIPVVRRPGPEVATARPGFRAKRPDQSMTAGPSRSDATGV
jgi:hypothetical protein